MNKRDFIINQLMVPNFIEKNRIVYVWMKRRKQEKVNLMLSLMGKNAYAYQM